MIRYALPAIAVLALAAAPALAETGHAKPTSAPAAAKPDTKQTAKPAADKDSHHKKHEKKS